MAPSRDTDVKDRMAIDLAGLGITGASEEETTTRMEDFRRRAGCCIKVTPWVSTMSCVMVAVGLAVWCIFTKRALALTQDVTLKIFDEPLYIVQQLTSVVGWTVLVAVIAVSCLLGITTLVSLLRTYQYTARLPDTSCGMPGKLCYGSYASLIALLNLGWWLLTVVVALMIAANLVWLAAAFMFESALYMGVTDTPQGAVPATTYYETARTAVDGLATYASAVQGQVPEAVAAKPEVAAMNAAVRDFLAASRDTPVTVCPVNCFNMGSFYDVLRLEHSCICSEASVGSLRNAATNNWRCLVHVLAALALMGLGCLWQLMNMSANFAHARRDMRSVPGRHTESQFVVSGDAVAAVATSPYSPGKKAAAATKCVPRDQDAGHTTDTAFPSCGYVSESAIEPVVASEHMTYNSAYDSAYQEAAAGAEAALPQRRANSPSPRAGELEHLAPQQPSPGSSRGNTFNTTAQRYAAYRLRAAQAAAAKSAPSNERKQWVR